jgi:hypothetical protein
VPTSFLVLQHYSTSLMDATLRHELASRTVDRLLVSECPTMDESGPITSFPFAHNQVTTFSIVMMCWMGGVMKKVCLSVIVIVVFVPR